MRLSTCNPNQHSPNGWLQPYPQKVVRPPKPTPTTFSGGGWSPRELHHLHVLLDLPKSGSLEFSGPPTGPPPALTPRCSRYPARGHTRPARALSVLRRSVARRVGVMLYVQGSGVPKQPGRQGTAADGPINGPTRYGLFLGQYDIWRGSNFEDGVGTGRCFMFKHVMFMSHYF